MARKNKKVSIQAKRRLIISRPICLFFVFLLVVTFGYNMVEYYNVMKEKEIKEEEFKQLQEKSDYLKKEIIKLNNPEYLARFAREHYSYSKEGEIILQLEKEETVEKVKTEISKKDTSVSFVLATIVVGIILLFYIIIRIIRRKKYSD